MKYRTILALLITITLGLGLWTWRTATHREFSVTFGIGDDEAVQWGEKAKHDRWVELVTLEFVDGEMTYVAVPNSQIDEHVRTADSLLVRRWLPSDEAAGMMGSLATHGYPGLSSMAGETAQGADSQQIRTRWMMALTVMSGLIAVGYGFIAGRKRTAANADHTGRHAVTEPPGDSSDGAQAPPPRESD